MLLGMGQGTQGPLTLPQKMTYEACLWECGDIPTADACQGFCYQNAIASPTGAPASEKQLIKGLDNKYLLLGGAALASLLILR